MSNVLFERVADRLDEGHSVGIFVGVTNFGNTHTGIVYRWRDTSYLYHHAFHNLTLNEEFVGGDIEGYQSAKIVLLDIPIERQKALAGFLRKLGLKRKVYPYTLKHYPDTKIHSETASVLPPEVRGLSCVTFVLAVFVSSLQFRLIDEGTWPEATEEDIATQKNLVGLLRNHSNASTEHIDYVESEIGCKRIRPEQVGGAGCYSVWPVGYAECVTASNDLMQKLLPKGI